MKLYCKNCDIVADDCSCGDADSLVEIFECNSCLGLFFEDELDRCDNCEECAEDLECMSD